jgi:iron complex outermembrane recepter protein
MKSVFQFVVSSALLVLSSLVQGEPSHALSRATLHSPIAPQSLAAALQAWARESGIQVLYATDLASGLKSEGAPAGVSAADALERLLAGTGLQYRVLNDRTISVLRSSTDASSNADTKRASADSSGAEEAVSPTAGVLRTAQSEDTNTATPQAAREAETDEMLDEVVVTAQKRMERLQEVPMSISVLNGEQLDKSSILSVTDALNRVPGVISQADGVRAGGTQISVRGVGASGPTYNGASPVGYYLDAVPIAQIRQAFVPDTNAFDLERVEVLRGPQGTLYGVNAENGLVRVLTHDADLGHFELKARTTLSSTEGSSENNYRGDAAVNIPIVSGKLAARAVVGYQNFRGWIDQPNERDINDGRVRNYRLKLNAQPTEALSIGLSAWRSNGERGGPSSADEKGEAVSVADQPAESDFDAYGLKIDYEFPGFSITSMTSYVDYTSTDIADLAPIDVAFGLDNVFTGQIVDSHYWSRTFSQEVLLSSASGTPWKWTAGVYYRDTADRFNEAIPVLGSFLDVPDTAESYAVFGELRRRFHEDQFEWALGLRYFHDELTSGQNVDPTLTGGVDYHVRNSYDPVTPRAVLTWYPNDDFMLYGSYSQGFRSGIPQPYYLANGAFGLPPVEPDKLSNYEIGTRATVLNKRLSLDAAVYFIDWLDVQQTTCVFASASQCFIAMANGDSASGIGVDLGVTARPTQGLDLGLAVSWNDLAFDSSVFTTTGGLLFGKGERLAYSSEYTVGASAGYAFPIGASGFTGSVAASGTYSSQIINRSITPTGAVLSSGDNLLVARASLTLGSPGERWTAMVFADNINDEDGAAGPASTLANVPAWYPRLRPRTVGIQVDVKF